MTEGTCEVIFRIIDKIGEVIKSEVSRQIPVRKEITEAEKEFIKSAKYDPVLFAAIKKVSSSYDDAAMRPADSALLCIQPLLKKIDQQREQLAKFHAEQLGPVVTERVVDALPFSFKENEGSCIYPSGYHLIHEGKCMGCGRKFTLSEVIG